MDLKGFKRHILDSSANRCLNTESVHNNENNNAKRRKMPLLPTGSFKPRNTLPPPSIAPEIQELLEEEAASLPQSQNNTQLYREKATPDVAKNGLRNSRDPLNPAFDSSARQPNKTLQKQAKMSDNMDKLRAKLKARGGYIVDRSGSRPVKVEPFNKADRVRTLSKEAGMANGIPSNIDRLRKSLKMRESNLDEVSGYHPLKSVFDRGQSLSRMSNGIPNHTAKLKAKLKACGSTMIDTSGYSAVKSESGEGRSLSRMSNGIPNNMDKLKAKLKARGGTMVDISGQRPFKSESNHVRGQNKDSSSSRSMSFAPPAKEERRAFARVTRHANLSDEQKRVINFTVNKGKSMFFTGDAGTGKSYLLREVIKNLRKKYSRDQSIPCMLTANSCRHCADWDRRMQYIRSDSAFVCGLWSCPG